MYNQMAKNEKEQQQPKQQEPSSPSKPVSSRPINITLPPRSFTETFLSSGPPGTSGFSPGPMTLLSGFFPGSDDCKSFSQLLSGTMASPNFKPADDKSPAGDFSRPGKLSMVPPSPMFTMPLGLSPVALPDSSGFGLFSPEGFGMIHQQALAQAAQTDSNMHVQQAPAMSSTQFLTFINNPAAHQQQQMVGSVTDSRVTVQEPSDFPRSYKRSESSSLAVDKPTDDGYNWRKYGQKQVKGSEFPRSYYKCTLPICPVKKKVERSLDGQVTEIIYKGQHNHEPPRPDKRGKDTGRINGSSNSQGDCEIATQFQSGNVRKMGDRKDQESSQATPEHVSGMSDYEEVSDTETGGQIDEDEPGPKRRTTEVRVTEPASSHKTVTESRIVVQTTSEVDLLDDGYRWRKYGQKVVKGNHYPRHRLLVLDRATISVAVKIGTRILFQFNIIVVHSFSRVWKGFVIENH
ncbi:WRKY TRANSCRIPTION FACTOR PROTEIN 1-RELATED [Salix purpurea]|uniref:WRKY TRANSCRIPTION FACTOR PROTEIN 1-RELATED n=1 Tax=Salix purpurea TaxID=77065 RepID=A0A9Q0UAW7_SALPP|nr:WRKY TRANSCRIPTION FACTOR PROTEIN 1-RELATED [Salix purpurea]KAJ6726680.1 WRKY TRANSCRIPTION FACTOR PROTEIN 1-RELATED [Salix purpurea]KAJ6726681.1 WRKY TRANSCRIPTION FACTOR PROTEIN 1-RELATED [Salix purpurea]